MKYIAENVLIKLRMTSILSLNIISRIFTCTQQIDNDISLSSGSLLSEIHNTVLCISDTMEYF